MDKSHALGWPFINHDGKPQPLFGFAIRHEGHTGRDHETVASQIELLHKYGVDDIRWLFDPTEKLHPTPIIGDVCTWCEDHLLNENISSLLLTFVCWRDKDIAQGSRNWFADWFKDKVPLRDDRPYFLHESFFEWYGGFLEWYARRKLPIIAVSFFNEALVEYEVDDDLTRDSFRKYLVERYGEVTGYNFEHGTDLLTWEEIEENATSYDTFLWRIELIPKLVTWAKKVFEDSSQKRKTIFGSNIILADPWTGTGLQVSDRGRDPAIAGIINDAILGDIYSNNLDICATTAKLLRGCSARQKPVILHELGGEHMLPWPDIELERKAMFLLFGHGITAMYLWGPGIVGLPIAPISLTPREIEFESDIRKLWDIMMVMDSRPNPWLAEYGKVIKEVKDLMPVLCNMKPIDPDISLVYSQHTFAAGLRHAYLPEDTYKLNTFEELRNPSGKEETSVAKIDELVYLSRALSNQQIPHDIVSDFNLERNFLPNTKCYLLLGTCFPQKFIKKIEQLINSGYIIWGIENTKYINLRGEEITPCFSSLLPQENLVKTLKDKLPHQWDCLQIFTPQGDIATELEIQPWTDNRGEFLVFLINIPEVTRELRLKLSAKREIKSFRYYTRDVGWIIKNLNNNNEVNITVRDVAFIHFNYSFEEIE